MKKYVMLLSVLTVCIIILVSCESKPNVGPEGITKSEFDKLQLGITELSASKIIGGLGEKIAEKNDDGVLTRTYKIKGENGGDATISFKQDTNKTLYSTVTELISKEQNDLK